jgi:hypothetical protein
MFDNCMTNNPIETFIRKRQAFAQALNELHIPGAKIGGHCRRHRTSFDVRLDSNHARVGEALRQRQTVESD